jgi:HK97 family phage portal protein
MSMLDWIKGMARQTAPEPHPRESSTWYKILTTSGVPVTADNVLTYAAVWCAVRVLSETVAKLPWFQYRETVTPSGLRYELMLDHPLRRLLNRKANPELPALFWRDAMMGMAVIDGNAYAEIERRRDGRPVALWPIERGRTRADRDSNGRLIYDITGGSASRTVLAASDVFHLRGPSQDGLVGYSLVRLANESLGLGLAMDKFVGLFFGSGAQKIGVLEVPKALTDAAYNRLKESFDHSNAGISNHHRPLILEEGLTWKDTSSDPDKSQLKDARLHQVEEVARWFKVPPHKLMKLSDATFSNIEQQNREFADEAIVPWACRMQAEADFKLFLDPEEIDHVSMMDLNALFAADAQARGQYYQLMLDRGVFSINEVRAMEGENDIGADGDVRFVPLNMTTLPRAINGEAVRPQRAADAEMESDDAA